MFDMPRFYKLILVYLIFTVTFAQRQLDLALVQLLNIFVCIEIKEKQKAFKCIQDINEA